MPLRFGPLKHLPRDAIAVNDTELGVRNNDAFIKVIEESFEKLLLGKRLRKIFTDMIPVDLADLREESVVEALFFSIHAGDCIPEIRIDTRN